MRYLLLALLLIANIAGTVNPPSEAKRYSNSILLKSTNNGIYDLEQITTNNNNGGDVDQVLATNGNANVAWTDNGNPAFNIRSATGTNIVINQGAQRWNGKLFCTYTLNGSITEDDLKSHLTFAAGGSLGTATYYMYLDTFGATSSTVTHTASGSTRTCNLVDNTDFYLSAFAPDSGSLDTTRYMVLGTVHATSNVLDSFQKENGKDAVTWTNLKLIEDKVVVIATGSTTTPLNASYTDIVWSTEDKDTNAAFNGTTFTAPRTSVYKFVVKLKIQGTTYVAGDYVAVRLFKNGATGIAWMDNYSDSAQDGDVIITKDIELTVNDTVKVQTYINGLESISALTNDGQYNYFSVSEVTNFTSDAVATPNNSFRAVYTAAPATTSCPAGYGDISLPGGFTGRTDYSIEASYLEAAVSTTVWDSVIGAVKKIPLLNKACIQTTSLSFGSGDMLEVVVSLGAKANASPQNDQSYEISNLSLTGTVSGSALTIAVKNKDGVDATGNTPIKIGFRDPTLATGKYYQRTITSALSLVISSGSTLGFTNGVAHYIYIYALDNGGVVKLAAIGLRASNNVLATTTAEGGAGAADSDETLYSDAVYSSKAIRLIGRFKATEATAGTWATAPSEITLEPVESFDAIAALSATSTITTETNQTYFGDASGGAFTTTIPNPTGGSHGGVILKFVNISTTHATNNWTIATPASSFSSYGNPASIVMKILGESVTIVSRAGQWHLLSHYIPMSNGVTDAPAGDEEEYLSDSQSSSVTWGNATGVYSETFSAGETMSLALTAGDWDVTAMVDFQHRGTTLPQFHCGITSTAGNNTTGFIAGSNACIHTPNATTVNDVNGCSVPNYRIKTTSTTTYYFKCAVIYTGTAPYYFTRFSARRVR